MMGHLTVEAHNEGGDMIAYRQTDNEVVDDGEQCILRLLFQENGHPKGRVSVPTPSPIENYPAGVNACIGELNGAWDTIAIGTDNDNGNYATGVAAATADTLVLLGNETSTSLGLQRGDATTKTWYNGTGSTPTKIVLSKTFTSDSPRAHAIGESGLFNSTTADANGMLARQTFTDVSLSDGDSITITWTFTVGN
jgi:hypothetical protein